METAAFTLQIANTPPLVELARTLMGEYAAMPHTRDRWLTKAKDLEALPTPYVPPAGVLLVAVKSDRGEQGSDAADDGGLGCGALMALDSPTVAEIKRVYVRPCARGRGLGEAITRALIQWADTLGFERVRLDTAPELVAAIALYERLGFTSIPPYRDGLLPDAVCFERAVRV